MYKFNYRNRNNDLYQYNYEDEVSDNQYIELNINLRNKIITFVLIIILVFLLMFLISQIFKHTNNSSKMFSTDTCHFNSNVPKISENELVDIILSNQLSM